MHKFLDKVTQNKNVSLLGALLYMSAPYHLNQLFINNSIQSALCFVFIPMIFLGLFRLLKTTEHSYHLAFGLIGLILTNYYIAAVTGVAILIYFIINFKDIPVEHSRKELLLNILAILTITAFFIFPLVEVNNATEYAQSNNTKQEFLDNRLEIKNLFITENSADLVFELGPHIIIMLAFSVMTFNRLKNEKKEYVFAFCMMILFLIMSTKIFPWQILPDGVKNLEYTYNCLSIAVFFECVVCATNMSIVLKKFTGKDVLILFGISVLYVMALKGYIPYSNSVEEIKNYDVSEITQIKCMPQKALDNIAYIEDRSKDVELLSGKARVEDGGKYLSYYSIKALTLEDGTIYEFPFLYYPGYKVTYDGIEVENFESENGLLAVKMDRENNALFEVNYVGTKIMNVTKVVSFVSMCVFSYYVYKKH